MIKILPKISYIIITYNSQETIERCIAGIVNDSYPKKEIIILDNNSQDETIKIVDNIKKVDKLIKLNKNIGFGKGCNKAVKASSGEFLFFVNPDVFFISRNTTTELINMINKNESIGAISPVSLVTMHNGRTVYVYGIKIKKASYLGFIKFFKKLTGRYHKIDALIGGHFLISKKLFNKLDGFDEQYFLFHEDIDLSLKIRREGKYIFCDSKVAVIHKNLTNVAVQPTKNLNKIINLIVTGTKFAYKWGGVKEGIFSGINLSLYYIKKILKLRIVNLLSKLIYLFLYILLRPHEFKDIDIQNSMCIRGVKHENSH